MSNTVVLLLGGPKDGELLAVESPSRSIRVTETDYYYEDNGDHPKVTWRYRYYLGKRINMFGRTLSVYTYEWLSEAEMDRLAFEHLTSDKAKAVVVR